MVDGTLEQSGRKQFLSISVYHAMLTWRDEVDIPHASYFTAEMKCLFTPGRAAYKCKHLAETEARTDFLQRWRMRRF